MNAAVFLALLLISRACAEPPTLRMSLAEAEAAALAHAPELKAAQEDSAAALDFADSRFSALLPRLSLNGSYQYQTEVPNFSPAPGTPPRPFGDHRATSVGPSLSWTLWDEGSLYKTWRAQKAAAFSQEELARLTRLSVVLGARLAYVQVQLAREQVRLLADSVALTSARNADIEKRLLAGAASRIDALSSHQTELQRRKEFLNAQAGLAASLRQLLQLTGRGEGFDVSRPLDVRLSSAPAGFAAATLLVDLDSLKDTPEALAAAEKTGVDPEHPAAAAYRRQAESARLAAQSLFRSEWPKIQLSAAANYQYPNGPVLQSVTQKTVGLSASLPLFEARQTSRLVDQQKHAAGAAEARRSLAEEQLRRDWDKAAAQLLSLRDQETLDQSAVAEAEDLSRLVYSSYKAGRSTYLEVQTYELNALQAKVQAAATRAQILIQLSTLAQLAGKG